jgi:hypothetical protein
MTRRLFGFVGGETGAWRVTEINTVVGVSLADVKRIHICEGEALLPPGASWLLRGITSNDRYVMRDEKELLVARQPGLGRPEANCAALIPIRKNAAWWNLPQDERRKVIEEQSRHIEIGLQYLPAIARRLHHCRDLGENEPFDFLTWFEFTPANETAFNTLLSELRASAEWRFVDREIDIRLAREAV